MSLVESRPTTTRIGGPLLLSCIRVPLNGNAKKDHREVVPDGQYKLIVKVLKALGDADNPAHWETWTSPTSTIDRP